MSILLQKKPPTQVRISGFLGFIIFERYEFIRISLTDFTD